MTIADDIARIVEQEQALEFPAFDENVGFAVAARIRQRGLQQGWPIVCDVRLWDRQVCYVALPGSSGE